RRVLGLLCERMARRENGWTILYPDSLATPHSLRALRASRADCTFFGSAPLFSESSFSRSSVSAFCICLFSLLNTHILAADMNVASVSDSKHIVHKKVMVALNLLRQLCVGFKIRNRNIDICS